VQRNIACYISASKFNPLQRDTTVYKLFTLPQANKVYIGSQQEHIAANQCHVRKVSREILEHVMSSATSGSLSSVPNGRIIDFEVAELKTMPFQDHLYLWVKGRLPVGSFEVTLAPRIYHARPEYWGIEVAIVPKQSAANDQDASNETGTEPASSAAGAMFERSVPLTGVTGNRGITVIGANQVKRIEITGESL
jgi:hypothetical protein